MLAFHAKETVTTKVQVSLAEIALVFLKLGVRAFGGPAAHIAMMEDEVRSETEMDHPNGVS
jgi:chromate transport protein ChrA